MFICLKGQLNNTLPLGIQLAVELREGEGERETERERESETESVRERVREREGGREKRRQIEGAREAEREDWSSGRRALTNSLMADVSPVL